MSEHSDRETTQTRDDPASELAQLNGEASPEPESTRDDRDFDELLAFIRESRGFDFTNYKRSTLTRRIRKRMMDARAASYGDYRDLLETNADEYNLLFNTILINVTGFFRDAEVWTFLQREVMPELVASLDPAEEIRIWSAGCSTGEEVYSLAMVLAETLGLDECVERVKIYGTDVDEEALRDARAGLYPAKAIEPVPEILREKYFEPNGYSRPPTRNSSRASRSSRPPTRNSSPPTRNSRPPTRNSSRATRNSRRSTRNCGCGPASSTRRGPSSKA